MDKLHITQDEHGYWMLSLEQEDGAMSLLAHHFATPQHLVENAHELVDTGRVRAAIVIDPPRPHSDEEQALAPDNAPHPVPRRAGE